MRSTRNTRSIVSTHRSSIQKQPHPLHLVACEDQTSHSHPHPALCPHLLLWTSHHTGEMVDKDHSLQIQTHISKNKSEVQQTLNVPGLFVLSQSWQQIWPVEGVHDSWTQVFAPRLGAEVTQREGCGCHCAMSNFNLGCSVALFAEMLRLWYEGETRYAYCCYWHTN